MFLRSSGDRRRRVAGGSSSGVSAIEGVCVVQISEVLMQARRNQGGRGNVFRLKNDQFFKKKFPSAPPDPKKGVFLSVKIETTPPPPKKKLDFAV